MFCNIKQGIKIFRPENFTNKPRKLTYDINAEIKISIKKFSENFNIVKKNLKSDILNQEFKLWISMKARKCIMKAGSLDNYLLNTKPKDISSKFGLYIRDLLIQK